MELCECIQGPAGVWGVVSLSRALAGLQRVKCRQWYSCCSHWGFSLLFCLFGLGGLFGRRWGVVLFHLGFFCNRAAVAVVF